MSKDILKNSKDFFIILKDIMDNTWTDTSNPPIPVIIFTVPRKISYTKPTSGTWILFPQTAKHEGINISGVTIANEDKPIWVNINQSDIQRSTTKGNTTEILFNETATNLLDFTNNIWLNLPDGWYTNTLGLINVPTTNIVGDIGKHSNGKYVIVMHSKAFNDIIKSGVSLF